MGPTDRVSRARTALAALGIPAGSRVFAACSGGADSMALAATLAHVAPREGWVAGAIIIEHGLRAGSAAEAAQVARQCQELGLPAHVRRVTVAGGGTGAGAGGPEAAARDARYAALAEEAGPDGLVLLGHTMDDQAETVLLGLARGSGVRSLAGMAPAVGRYRRPFLGLRRADTTGICGDLGLPYVEDPSNRPDGPLRRSDGGPLRRSALRHRVIPALEEALGPGVIPALARTGELARMDADYLEGLAEAAYLEATVGGAEALPADAGMPDPTADGTGSGQLLSLEVAKLAVLPDAVRTRVVHRAIMEQAGPGARGAVGSRHVEAVDRLLTEYRGQGEVRLPGFVAARRWGGRLEVWREPHGNEEDR